MRGPPESEYVLVPLSAASVEGTIGTGTWDPDGMWWSERDQSSPLYMDQLYTSRYRRQYPFAGFAAVSPM